MITKGPWAVNEDGWMVESDKEHGWVNDGWIVCKTEGPDRKDNAHLIAAAPELLEALEGMTERYTELANSGDCGFWDCENENEVKAARAAIKKAKGE